MLTKGDGSSENGKWKDATITLINNNPNGAYEYQDLLDPARVITVYTETTVHIPVLNTPPGKTYLPIDFFARINPEYDPICTGNVEYSLPQDVESAEGEFIITGNGTITLTGGGTR